MGMFSKFKRKLPKPNRNDEVHSIPEHGQFPPMSAQDANILCEFIMYLSKVALNEEGLYRIEGSISERNELVEAIKEGKCPEFEKYSVHSISSAIKYV